MTTFDERERAFEGKFARDQEEAFKAKARCGRMLGEWAGGVLRKSGTALHAYADEVVRTAADHAGDDAVVRGLEADLQGRPEAGQVRAKLEEFRSLLQNESGPGG